MPDMRIEFYVENPNEVEVDASVVMHRYEEGKTLSDERKEKYEKEVNIDANSNTKVSFDIPTYDPDDILIAWVTFYPVGDDGDTYLKSRYKRILDNFPIKPFDITSEGNFDLNNLEDPDGDNGTGADWGLDFTIQGGTECINDVELLKELRGDIDLPVNYRGDPQIRVVYELIAGQNMQSQSGDSIGIGQGPEVKIELQDYKNNSDSDTDGVRVRMYESGSWPSGDSQSGTFELRAEAEVYNPDTGEWSVFDPRVTVTKEYDWTIIA